MRSYCAGWTVTIVDAYLKSNYIPACSDGSNDVGYYLAHFMGCFLPILKAIPAGFKSTPNSVVFFGMLYASSFGIRIIHQRLMLFEPWLYQYEADMVDMDIQRFLAFRQKKRIKI
jgi:hypothetical protein